MAPELVAEFVRNLNEEVNRARCERNGRRGGLLREQKEIAGRIDTLLEAVGSGTLKGASVQAKLDVWEARRLELERELEGLNDEPVRLHPHLADLYRRNIATVHDLLGSEATRTEAVELIRSVVDQVTFRPTASDGLEIALIGDLVRMIHLAQQSAEISENSSIAGAVHEEFACSVKVVAGSRYQRYLPISESWIEKVSQVNGGCHLP